MVALEVEQQRGHPQPGHFDEEESVTRMQASSETCWFSPHLSSRTRRGGTFVRRNNLGAMSWILVASLLAAGELLFLLHT